mmetsp:Transcript_118123/g.329354  ORF Transcript_118123/g.329354 Transcript_118123/m.329354 type:complete len:269 (+) Transcript_118123:411-1217(+)
MALSGALPFRPACRQSVCRADESPKSSAVAACGAAVKMAAIATSTSAASCGCSTHRSVSSCKGYRPSSSCTTGGTPPEHSAATTSGAPCRHAVCSAVEPKRSVTLVSAEHRISSKIASVPRPLLHPATWMSGEAPREWVFTAADAPRCSNKRASGQRTSFCDATINGVCPSLSATSSSARDCSNSSAASASPWAAAKCSGVCPFELVEFGDAPASSKSCKICVCWRAAAIARALFPFASTALTSQRCLRSALTARPWPRVAAHCKGVH